MDNGAYEKYKQENPDVYTPLSTYDYVDKFVHQLSNAELVICGVAIALAVIAIYKIFARSKDNHSDDHHNDQ